MDFNLLLHFLEDLNKNNSKQWMDLNRKRYHQVRNTFIEWLDKINLKLAEIDKDYYFTPGRKGIIRINNNLLYHPNKPVYKDYFGAGFDKAPGYGDFYVEIGLEQSLFAGGIWRPQTSKLNSIRQAIDFNGEELMAILMNPSFKNQFGGLYKDEKLKTAPKGFSKSHPYLSLLQNKSFGVVHTIPKNTLFDDKFEDYLLDIYIEMLPFRRYLNRALTV